MQAIARIIVAFLFLIPAAIIDAKERRIPNMLTFPMMGIGLLWNLIWTPYNLRPIVLLILACLLISLIPGIGMGDIKLVMGIGFFFNVQNTVLILGVASIALVGAAFIRSPYTTSYLLFRRFTRPWAPPDNTEKNEYTSAPLAPYLLAASVLVEGGIILWNLIVK